MKNKIIALVLILGFVIFAGCINSGEKSIITTSPLRSYDSSISEKGMALQASQDNEGRPVTTERKVISTATLTIEVADVSLALDEIMNITIESGGYISSSSINDMGNNRKSGFLTARVPQKYFYSNIEKIASLGIEKYRQIQGQDVTEEFIDLGARLDNLKRQETRLQEILKMTTTVKDILEVEKELGRIRGEIESLTGRLNYLNQSVEMSTITVHVQEPAPLTGEGWGISEALREAVRGFIESVRGIIVFTGFIIPILIYIILAILIASGIRNKILPRMRR